MTAIPSGRSGLMPLPSVEDTLPKFTDEEITQRTVILENLSLSVTGQELIEFFNGAVLAVTANAVQQASHKTAPVFACTVTEEDRGSSKRKSAELKFRTVDGASVCMKLNGIEYKGYKVNIKRPDNYVVPDDGDPSTKLDLHDVSMAKLVGEAASRPQFQGPAPKLSIFNLPDVMSEQVCRDLLSQFGRLRMLSLIRDLNTGKIKGYGIFEYDDPNDVDLAIVALNGFVCGQNVIRVQKLGGASQTAAPKPQPVAATAMSNSMTQKIVSNPVLAMQVKQGREIGSRPSTIVQLLNAVYQEDLMDDQDYEDITAEVHAEASKHGTVARVVIPKPAKDGSFVDGVGKIFVSFTDLTAARKFQIDANGRKFENRVVCAAFYPVERFNEGKYKLWSTA
jgi:splicing factor U2AF subunit